MYNMSTTFKKLRHQYSYLKLEEKEVRDICSETDKKMKQYISKVYPEYYKKIYNILGSSGPILDVDSKPEENKDKKTKSNELKSLYRKIAKKTHPDKKTGNSTLFEQSARAYSENNLGDLLEIASDANVSIPKDLLTNAVTLLEDNISSIEDKIKHHKSTTAWSWYKSKNDEDKKVIIINILKHIGE